MGFWFSVLPQSPQGLGDLARLYYQLLFLVGRF
jgi:hypothetical protein